MSETNTKRHKWADVIIAWANGEEIQVRSHAGEWEDFKSKNPSFGNDMWEWRIKPKQQTGWIAIYKRNTTNIYETKEQALEQYSHLDPEELVTCIQITYTEGGRS